METPFPSETLVDALLRAKAKALQENRSLYKAEMVQVVDQCLQELWKKLPAHKRKKPVPGGDVINEEWLQSLRDDPANQGIDVDQQLHLCRLWVANRPGLKLTRRRFVNWLIKQDRPLPMHTPGRTPLRKTEEPAGWKDWVNEAYPESIYAKGGECEHYTWAMLTADIQAKFAREMKQ